MKRYEPDNPPDSAPSMKEDATGDWVRYDDHAAAIAALEADVARVSAIAHNAIDEWASWVHDQLDGTSSLAEAIADVDAARAALADQPAEGGK